MAGAPPPTDPAISAFWTALNGSKATSHPGSSNHAPTDADLIRAWQNQHPGMGAGEDAGRSFVTGLQRGVTFMAGAPAAAQDLLGKAADIGSDIGARLMGHGPLTPEQHAQVRAGMTPPVALAPAVLADRRNAIANHVTGALTGHEGTLPTGSIHATPTTADLDQSVQAAFGPYHIPQTWQGRLAETAGEFAPNALMPGGLVARGARVILPAMGSTAAGEAARGSKYEPAARVIGGVAGGGLESLGEMAFAAPDRVFANATRGLTQEQVEHAGTLRANAARQGIQLTVPEAVQQVTNGATGLGRVQRLVENTNRTAPDMRSFFADRPNQVRGAVEGFVGDVAPNMPTRPAEVISSAQNAGQDILSRTNAAINLRARPYYDALDGVHLDQGDFSALMKNHAFAEALDSLKNDPTLSGELTAHPPVPPRSPDPFAPAAPDPDAEGLARALDDIRTYGTQRTGSLFSAIADKGGLKLRAADGSSLAGPDVAPLLDGVRRPGLVNNASGLSGERMAQSLADDGWFGPDPGDPYNAFMDAMEKEARGQKVFHPVVNTPGFEDSVRQLAQELGEAGVGAADAPQAAASKLWDLRNGDNLERAAIQSEGSANDPAGLEFDRLSGQGVNLDPYNDLANVMRVRQQLGIMGENARPSPVNPYSNATKANLYDQAQMLADVVGGKTSPAWRQALDTVSEGRANELEPLQRGPVGGIATGQDIPSQTGALYPQNPPLGHANATGEAGQLLMQTGEDGGYRYPDVLANLTGQHVGNTFNQAMRDLSSGPNQYGGALFAKNIAGNAEQARTLDAGLSALDPTGELQSRFGDLIDALQATGRRERPGSMTAFNSEDLNALKMAPDAVRFLGGLGDPLEWTKNLSNFTGNKLYGRNLDVLRDMILDPDTGAVLQRAAAAQTPPPIPPQVLIPALAGAQGDDQ